MTPSAIVRLIRLPNLPTAAADVVAGYVLAGGEVLSRLPGLVFVSVAIYAGGAAWNDLVDAETDRGRHPDRPLPSRAVSRRRVLHLVLVCFLSALVAAAAIGPVTGLAAAGVLLAVAVYNGGAKRSAFPGAVAMGACRGGNVLLGAAGAGWPSVGAGWVLPCAGISTLYAFLLLLWSRGEDAQGPDAASRRRRTAGWVVAGVKGFCILDAGYCVSVGEPTAAGICVGLGVLSLLLGRWS